MGKLDYLDALKRAMHGLMPATQAKTLAWYEQRFVDGVAAGRIEADIAEELGDPRKVALSLRTSTHLDAFAAKKHPANGLRVAVSAAGLLVFNLFMAIPAAVYAALLTAVYACALGFYVSGIAITASGLAGANELVLDNPLHRIERMEDGSERRTSTPSRTRVTIGEQGIHVYQDDPPPLDDGASGSDTGGRSGQVIRRAEKVADTGIQITTGLDQESRTTQTFFGLGMVLGGILLFLLSLVVTRYTFIGLRRYLRMNMSLLKGA